MLGLILSLENQVPEEQRKGKVFFILRKIGPHMAKDVARMDEERLQWMLRSVGRALTAVADGEEVEMPAPPPELLDAAATVVQELDADAAGAA